MRIRLTGLLGLAILLFGCAEQPTGLAGGYSYGGPDYATSAYPGYGYAPGYLGPGFYGSDVLIGGGGYWAGGEDRDRYWHRRYRWDRDAWQERELRRHQNEAEPRAQAWQQLQQQKAASQAAQAQAAMQQQQQRAAAQAAQNQALWQQRVAQQQALSAAQAQAAMQQQQQRAAAQALQAQALQQRAQAVQQMYQQRAQALAAQQQAAARARGLTQ